MLRVSLGELARADRELDDLGAGAFRDETVFAISFLCPLHPPFHEQLEIIRTGLVLIEAVTKRIPKSIEIEVLRAARIGPVQKGAMRRRLFMTDS